MVKAKKLVKPKKLPKSASKDSKNMDTSRSILSNCIDCDRVISDDTCALQCERFEHREVWKCADCIGLSSAQYELLTGNRDLQLHWFCDTCERKILDKGSEQTDNMISLGLLEQLVLKINVVEQKLIEKASTRTTDELSDRITKIEGSILRLCDMADSMNGKLDSLATNTEAAIAADTQSMGGGTPSDAMQGGANMDNVQMKLDELMMKITSPVNVPEAVQDYVEEIVRNQFSEDKKEMDDIDKRRTSVIIHGLPESLTITPKERFSDDEKAITEMLQEIDCSSTEVKKLFVWAREQMIPKRE